MSLIKGGDTKPEWIVRRLVFKMGYRYRLHEKAIIGKPDLVFRKRKKIIFVNGCFWHLHGCGRYKMPRTRTIFWTNKLLKNKKRDIFVRHQLRRQGWRVLVLWECETKNVSLLERKLKAFLG